ncbi:hypothetical protein EV121DRAFT_288711 [Schizophyllum commune]
MLDEHLVDKVNHEVILRLDSEPVLRSTSLVPTSSALQTQVMPPDGEVCTIKNAIDDERRALEHCADLIAKGQQWIDSLRSTYDRMNAAISLKTSLVSSIRRLPTEVLANIITYALLLSSPKGSVARLKNPVMHVCRLWREVALSLSLIWADIDICFEYDLHRWDQLAECLHRAEGKPLSLALESMGDHAWVEEEFIQIFLASAARWQRLTLRDMALPAWFNTDALHAPALEHLEIKDSDVEGWLCFARCPALSSVVLENVCRSVPPSDLPWGQLSSLDITSRPDFDVDDLLEAIRGCNRLITLRLSMDSSVFGDHPEVVLPSLTSLVLADRASSLLRVFHVPSLVKLQVDNYDDDFRNLEAYAAKGETVAPTLTSLTLCALEEESDWVRLFELYANISELYVHGQGNSGNSLIPLCLTLRHRQDLLPNLIRLDFPSLQIRRMQDVHLMQDIVEDRVDNIPAGATPLARLTFDTINPEYVQRMLMSVSSLECHARWPVEYPVIHRKDPSDDEDVGDEHPGDGDAYDEEDEVGGYICRMCAQGFKTSETEEALVSDDAQSPIPAETDDLSTAQAIDVDKEASDSEPDEDYAMCSSDDGSIDEEWITQEFSDD